MKLGFVRTLVLIAALCVACPLFAAEPQKFFKVGVITELSGDLVTGGNITKRGYDLWAKEVNAKGGIDIKGTKYPVKLVYADAQSNPAAGAAAAERLITQEKVHALFGAYFSSVTATASQVAERYGVPYMNAESSSPGLTERGFKWFFRTSPHDGHFSVAMFDFMKDLEKRRGLKIKTLGIMHEDTLFGVDSAKVQEELAKKYGYEVTVKMAYRAKTTNLDAEVGKLKAANPDVFLPTSYTSDAILFVKTAKNLDYNPKLLLAQNAGWTDPTFVTEMGKDVEGHITRAPFALDMASKKPMIRQVNEAFKKLKDNPGGRDISDVPARAFTGFITLADAINRAKSVNPEEVRKALVATNIPPDQLIMPWSGVKFDEKGQNTGVRAILQQVQKGAYATIYPFELAAADVMYPLAPWKDRK